MDFLMANRSLFYIYIERERPFLSGDLLLLVVEIPDTLYVVQSRCCAALKGCPESK